MNRKESNLTNRQEIYRSPYEAYPFLADPGKDLRCDFELLTDELSSLTGLLRSIISAPGMETDDIRGELTRINELIYHANPTLRTHLTLTGEEVKWLRLRTMELQQEAGGSLRHFVLPEGNTPACTAHLLRVKAKCLVRLLYRYDEAGGRVPDLLFDFCNLLSGYFFGLGLKLNRSAGISETEFISRNYSPQ